MTTDSINNHRNLIQTLDEILNDLEFDIDHPIKIVRMTDGREVITVRPNPFTVSRMYTSGRPDGRKPYGKSSYHEYIQSRMEDYQDSNGSDEGFELTEEEWQTLFDESYDRYTRYLLCAGIKRWHDVKRDTDTNLAVTNLAKKFAPPEIAWQSYQYKGYMLMMNSIASAELSLMEDNRAEALNLVNDGIQRIGQYCGECLRENHGEAENITRERYLANLIEFRTDIESVEKGTEEEGGNGRQEEGDDGDATDILDELEQLLGEQDR
ncbi:MAG: DNA helicase UvrBC [Candidatus Poribacteria bacterium]|nr:DNA helicase UvrBC [Candidatus Poribacteria bacterium]